MANCAICGKQIDDGAVFCPSCGTGAWGRLPFVKRHRHCHKRRRALTGDRQRQRQLEMDSRIEQQFGATDIVL